MSKNDSEIKQQFKQLTNKQKQEIMKNYQLSEMPTAQDKMQTILSENGILPNPYKFAKLFFKDKIGNKLLMCPFCLNPQHLSDFIYDKGYYKCLKCKNRITEKTLDLMYQIFTEQKQVKIDQFAVWVFNYRLSGFFDKINFQEWNKKLWELGLSLDFWGYYKKLKGENQQQREIDE